MPSTIKISKSFIQELYQPTTKHSHKGIQGHALLIGGSYGKIGSVCLASKAALKSGCGLVTAFIPKCGYQIIQTNFPEAMVLTDVNVEILSKIDYNFTPNSIGIGMGMGQTLETQKAFYDFLVSNKQSLVIDADALNILSENIEWVALLPEKTILTPHKMELERLIGVWKTDDEKLEKVTDFAVKNNLIIVVKGAPTEIVYGKTVYKNSTGNQALATAGSGDVLTGIITGLLAQQYQPLHAAILGVYLHGLTADLALPETGYQSFLASDIINCLGKAYLSLESK